MDPQVHDRILKSVLQSRKGSAVIWVLNRVEQSRNFDQVLVMDRGHLVEQGGFDELASRTGGVLYKLLHPGQGSA
jgi:ATP-binding cassette subfamily B protein